MSFVAGLAHSVGIIRRATEAAGSRIRVSELEILLHIAGGLDDAESLAEVTGLSRYGVTQACRFLGGHSNEITLAGQRATRVSPLALIKRRRHPHQKGFQYALSLEGRGLLSSVQLPPIQEWSQ